MYLPHYIHPIICFSAQSSDVTLWQKRNIFPVYSSPIRRSITFRMETHLFICFHYGPFLCGFWACAESLFHIQQAREFPHGNRTLKIAPDPYLEALPVPSQCQVF